MHLDSHQHFWHYDPNLHAWMTEQMAILRRDYLPTELEPLLRSAGMDGTIAVQARQDVEETDWLLELAAKYEYIKGVVGWVDLRSPRVRPQLEEYAKHPHFVGVRHIVQDEPDDEFMDRKDFRKGIGQLREFGLTYDLLIHPRHLPAALRLVRDFPGQKFVVDHLAKPSIRTCEIEPWRQYIKELATYENVFCKLSGMVTEAAWGRWQSQDFEPYLDTALNAFGAGRLMLGSDWPVCNLSADYGTTIGITLAHVKQLSQVEQELILGGTCARFYNLGNR